MADFFQVIVTSTESALDPHGMLSTVPGNIPTVGPGSEKRLEKLHTDELKNWMSMSENSIPLPAHDRRKKRGI